MPVTTSDKLKMLPFSTANTSNPPTQAEMVSAYGSAASAGAGRVILLDDNGGNANDYLVVSNGTSWWYVALTKGA
jgi:hypothetical protein